MLGCSLEKWEDGNMEGVKQAAGSLSSPRKGRLDFRLELERSPTGWRSGQRFAWRSHVPGWARLRHAEQQQS